MNKSSIVTHSVFILDNHRLSYERVTTEIAQLIANRTKRVDSVAGTCPVPWVAMVVSSASFLFGNRKLLVALARVDRLAALFSDARGYLDLY